MSSRNGPNSMDGHSRRPNFSNEVKTVEDGKQTEIRAKNMVCSSTICSKEHQFRTVLYNAHWGQPAKKSTKIMKFRKYLI